MQTVMKGKGHLVSSERSTRIRLIIILAVFTLMIGGLFSRFIFLQFVEGEALSTEAYDQRNRDVNISQKRGAILDRNGEELAVDMPIETVNIDPNILKKSILDESMTEMEVAMQLSEILGIEGETVLNKIQMDSQFQLLKKNVERDATDKIREFRSRTKLKGIMIELESKRFYKNKNLAAHVIGMTGEENQGLSGIESVMSKYIVGTPGRILSDVDANNRVVPLGNELKVDAQDGKDVVLTIDTTIQFFATKALENAIENYEVRRGGVIIVMDPRNGDILALVSKPDFDLNDPYAKPVGVEAENWNGRSEQGVETLNKTVWRNKAIMDTYEPGSTFKAVTTAAGLEEGVVTLDTPFVCQPVTGYGPNPIGCWTIGNHGTQDLTHAVYNSCNPAFMSIAQKLGVSTFYRYVRDFGFYDKTGMGMAGEVTGIFHEVPKTIDMLVASFGQRFTITPMQLITAYAPIANGGNLMKPRLIKELRDANGNVIEKYEPELIRKVISKETSDKLRVILEGVVSEGTGKNAYVKGYRVAGKTGTSETVEEGRYIASFCCFAPADNPVVSVLIMLDDPAGDHMGGAIAAPVAQKLMEELLTYLEVERQYSERDLKEMVRLVAIPELRGKTVEEAVKLLKDQGFGYKLQTGISDLTQPVRVQTPLPDQRVPDKSVIILYTDEEAERIMVTVPDLMNKTVIQATDALKDLNLNLKITGAGVAKGQSIAAGEQVEAGTIIEVTFRHTVGID